MEGSSDSSFSIACSFLPRRGAANFEMVHFNAHMTNFSISWAFASEMWTIAKFKSLVLWLQMLWLDIISFLLKFSSRSAVGWNLRISRACFRVSSAAWPALIALDSSSMACTNCFGQSEVAFSKKPLTKGVISGTSYNHIFH